MSMISPAFSDAVHDSQQCFRQLLKAMSEPGKAVTLDRCEGFGSLMSATAQTLLTLADNASPIWLSDALAGDQAVTENIKFHIGTATTPELNQASFAVFAASDLVELRWRELGFNTGNEAYPDSSTTVIVECDSLHAGISLRLSGPGIESERDIKLGIPELLADYLVTRQALVKFPLGVDFIFICNTQAVCLPRTTNVEVSACTLL